MGDHLSPFGARRVGRGPGRGRFCAGREVGDPCLSVTTLLEGPSRFSIGTARVNKEESGGTPTDCRKRVAKGPDG